MKTRRMLALATLALVLSPVAHAKDSPRPLFASEDPVHVTIRGPLNQIARNAPTSKARADGSLVEDGASEPLPIKLSARGISRRQADACTFPPLRVEFTSKPPHASLFRGQKKLKLVTHCQGSSSFQQYLLLEYAAYRMYNILSPLSFDVRLAKIDYIDASGRPITSKMGFFIEDENDMAKRNGLRSAQTGDSIPIRTLRPAEAGREAIFQYMIGNLDWAMNGGPPHAGCCHNTKLIASKGATADFIPVPYDFDSTGFVDPPYAAPPDGLNATDVRDRQYRGFCIHNAEATAAAADILAKRPALLSALNVPGLDESARRRATAYLDQFFKQIGSEKAVQDNLLRRCLR